MPRKLNEQLFCGWCGSKVTYRSDWYSVCDGCGYRNYLAPRPSCSLIINRGDEILVTKRAIEPKKGKFDLPGGFMDVTDASINETIYRELFEELQIDKDDITPPQLVGSGMENYTWHDTELPVSSFVFVCKLLDPDKEPTLNQSENTQFRWMKKADIMKLELAWNTDKEMLKIYLEGN